MWAREKLLKTSYNMKEKCTTLFKNRLKLYIYKKNHNSNYTQHLPRSSADASSFTFFIRRATIALFTLFIIFLLSTSRKPHKRQQLPGSPSSTCIFPSNATRRSQSPSGSHWQPAHHQNACRLCGMKYVTYFGFSATWRNSI